MSKDKEPLIEVAVLRKEAEERENWIEELEKEKKRLESEVERLREETNSMQEELMEGGVLSCLIA